MTLMGGLNGTHLLLKSYIGRSLLHVAQWGIYIRYWSDLQTVVQQIQQWLSPDRKSKSPIVVQSEELVSIT